MKQFESIINEVEYIEEGYSTEKPKPEPGYKIVRQKIRQGKKIVTGWKKIKVSKAPSEHISKAKAKLRAKKASLTKKRNPAKMRKAAKKAEKTKAANK